LHPLLRDIPGVGKRRRRSWGKIFFLKYIQKRKRLYLCSPFFRRGESRVEDGSKKRVLRNDEAKESLRTKRRLRKTASMTLE
jgi:hypothetical protein